MIEIKGYLQDNLVVDDKLSDTSENPVQNKVVAAELAKKMEKGAPAEFSSIQSFGEINALSMGNYNIIINPTDGTISGAQSILLGGEPYKVMIDRDSITLPDAPTEPTDAANKGYVDTKVAKGEDIDLQGHALTTMTVSIDDFTVSAMQGSFGNLTVSNDPTQALEVATKQYVDNHQIDLNYETWTFTLSNGMTVNKKVAICL